MTLFTQNQHFLVQENLNMDKPLSFWRVIVVLLSLSLLSFSQPIKSQLLNFNSVANLSSSWINDNDISDSIFLNSTESVSDYSSSLTPILFSKSNVSQFVCGFYCVNGDLLGYSSCLFGILIFQSIQYDNKTVSALYEPRLVWSANRNHPVHFNSVLNFTRNGNLILKDEYGSLIWSTNTRDKNIAGLKLTKTGNLVLYNKTNGIVWQSFDDPTDVLLPGQSLVIGKNLISDSNISPNFSQGLYSLSIQDNLLFAQIEADPPQVYFRTDYFVNEYIKFSNSSLTANEGPLQLVASFMRLESDGHLRVYELGGSISNAWEEVMDVFSSIGECGYPKVCGSYGMCSNGQCSCIEQGENEATNLNPISRGQPNLGCSMVTPISCKHSPLHTLVELVNVSYFYLNWDSNAVPEIDSNISVEHCTAKCLRNCSCKAAVYVYSVWGTSGCLLLSEVFSLMESYENVSVYLKIENSQSTLHHSGGKSLGARRRLILGSSIGALFGSILLLSLCFLFYKRKNKEQEQDDIEFNVDQLSGMPMRFSYEDLKATTNNFNVKLGQGGFGSVFQGILNDGTKIAVKHLDGLGHIKKSFLAEVETIGSIHHVNLVSLIGFCAENTHRLLVYDYMPNGSLDKWIFQKNQDHTLAWQLRKKIILDIAKGLTYLHEDCKRKIFHLDVKPQNILLDEDFVAKVSDFGLAKLIDKDQSRIFTTLRGTPGYLAPEWLSSIITEKVDVYSFGVVVLEILCGRRNIDHSQVEDEMHLLALIKRKAEEGRFEDVIDKHHDMQLHEVEVIEMMKVAVWCLQSDFSKRPTMSIVVKVLEGSASVETDLDYNFTNFTAWRTNSPPVDNLQNNIRDVTAPSPVPLSGPR